MCVCVCCVCIQYVLTKINKNIKPTFEKLNKNILYFLVKFKN